MAKQEIVKHLTELMATVQMAHFKGRETGVRVHENPAPDSLAISIDLYHFEGDGKPVCDGLNPCTITCDDGSTMTGNIFCMVYDPRLDAVTPLVFLFELPDIEVDPEKMPEESLKNVLKWLEQEMVPKESETNVSEAKEIIALWSDWCMNWSDENLWLDYMVKHPKGHCNRQHLQEKWDYCYEKYGSKAAMTMFWRELDNDNRAILTEYITTQWHKTN